MHRSKSHHSITSSARASSVGGILRPSDVAVLRLITISQLIGSWIGRSAGLAPFRMRSITLPPGGPLQRNQRHS